MERLGIAEIILILTIAGLPILIILIILFLRRNRKNLM